MASPLTITWDVGAMRKFRAFPEVHRRAVAEALARRADDLSREFVFAFQSAALSGRPGVRKVTGSLTRSLGTQVQRPPGMVVVRAGFGVPRWSGGAQKYAPVHEFGAIIRPVRRKWLAIPVSRTPAGAARFRSPTTVKDGFFFTSRAGNLMFGRRRGKRGGIEPLFVLKKRVRVPARLGFRRRWREFEPKAMRAFQAEVSRLYRRLSRRTG